MILLKTKAAWSEQRTCWRIDIQFQNAEGQAKRTFVVIPSAAPDRVGGAREAERAAKEFRKGVGVLYSNFMAKNNDSTNTVRPVAAVKAVPALHTRKNGPTLSLAWLLDRCLDHPEVWGNVAHPANYVSGVKKLNALVGDRLVSEFESPHGRKLVIEVVNALRAEKYADGYVRKIAGQLRQALGAAIGQGISEPICDPTTGAQLIGDIPTFPPLPKGKGRTAVLDAVHDPIIFEIIRARGARAAKEERAYAFQYDRKHELGKGAAGIIEVDGASVWLNARRFTSSDWRVFGDFIRFLLETGCRLSEALSVGNHSVRYRETTDDDGAVIETRPVLLFPGEVTKNGDDRFINPTPSLVALMKVWQAFATPHTFKIGKRTVAREKAWFPLNQNQVGNMWEHVRTDAKKLYSLDLDDISAHNLRHTHATRMSARGMSGKPLQEHLGHRDERTTRIYDHAVQVDNSARFYKRNVSGG